MATDKIREQTCQKILVDGAWQVLLIFRQIRTPRSNEREYLSALVLATSFDTAISAGTYIYKARLIRPPQTAGAQTQTTVPLILCMKHILKELLPKTT